MEQLFSPKELDYLQDTDFLMAKQRITDKLMGLLEETKVGLHNHLASHPFSFPEGIEAIQGKISKGEQYRQLPYLVLDYPRKFTRADIFAFRTMFWWGHEFSCTFMLAEKSWDNYRDTILKKLPQDTYYDWYIGVNNTPWEHHFEEDNYRPVRSLKEKELIQLVQTKPFFKISRKLSLHHWEKLPDFAVETFAKILKLLED